MKRSGGVVCGALRAIALVSCLLLLCGCVHVDSEFVVHSNGRVDFALTTLQKEGLTQRLFKGSLDEAYQDFRARGYTVSPAVREGYRGYCATTNGLSVAEINAVLAEGGTVTALTVSRGLFRTRYVLDYKLDGEPEPDWFMRRAMDSLRVSIAVTLPAEPQRHNADRTEVDGGKLIWEFRGDPGPMAMRADLVQWHIWRIVGIAALFALFGVWAVARIQGGTP